MSSTVTYAFTEVRLGLAPAVVSLTVLPRIAERPAARHFLTGDTFDAYEADSTVDAARSWRRASPQERRETKALLNRSLVHSIDELGQQVGRQSVHLFGSEEAIEAMSAFLEKLRRARPGLALARTRSVSEW